MLELTRLSVLCYAYYVIVAAADRQQNLSRAHPLSDINRQEETTTTYQELNENTQGQPVNYQQLPTPAEPHNYYNITNTAQDTSTANSPYEELDINRLRYPVYQQLATT